MLEALIFKSYLRFSACTLCLPFYLGDDLKKGFHYERKTELIWSVSMEIQRSDFQANACSEPQGCFFLTDPPCQTANTRVLKKLKYVISLFCVLIIIVGLKAVNTIAKRPEMSCV